MMIGILQPAYLPWLGFFEQMDRVDLFVLHDDIQYTKSDWRNRNKIRTNTGWSWLSVPIRGGEDQRICEAHIDHDQRWSKRHVNLLRENYRGAPFYKEYMNDIEEILRSRHVLIAELDYELIIYMAKRIGITTPIEKTSSKSISGKSTERLINICREYDADAIYEGAAGKKYIDERALRENGITIEYQEYAHPTYRQLQEPFIPYLSTIDLMFCHGPDSKRIITNYEGRTAL